MEQEVIKTQSERLADELKKLSVDVTIEDRKLYQKKSKTTRSTVSRYLNGIALDADRAADMIEFFRGRIEEREKALTK